MPEAASAPASGIASGTVPGAASGTVPDATAETSSDTSSDYARRPPSARGPYDPGGLPVRVWGRS
ncbi:hypothetical protein Skr01_71290 [Sphaerisporangium krabiense]|nr:hypothetical protein Skr01_71290 [Sphaerisporangium krabiense]